MMILKECLGLETVVRAVSFSINSDNYQTPLIEPWSIKPSRSVYITRDLVSPKMTCVYFLVI